LDFLTNNKHVSIDIININEEMGAEFAVFNDKAAVREMGRTPNAIGSIIYPND